jgi:RsiW-degrading membrane proteinase PrsW (M82 family)
MAILVTCACGKTLRVPDALAGKRGRCPACKTLLTIPDPAAAAPPAEPDLLPDAPPAPAAADAPAAAPPAEPAAPPARRSVRDYLYCVLLLALIPLAFSLLGGEKDDVGERLKKSIESASPERQLVIANLAVKAAEGKATEDDLISALPDGRIQGAHLPRRTGMHWIYALLSAGAFFALLLFLFPRGAATPQSLVTVGVFTGTLGILFLIAVQYVAAWTQGLWITGRGVLTILFYIAKFVGFSYRGALDADNGFLISFIGFTCGVGLCEEVCKALPIVWHYRRKATLDWRGACLWGLATGIGFGVSEAITYSSDFYNGVMPAGIYWVRFVSCVTLHAIWSAAVGIMIYRGQQMIQGEMEWYALAWAVVRLLLVAMILHGLYDTMLKKEMNALALLTALGSFGWLAWMIERLRRAEGAAAPAAA